MKNIFKILILTLIIGHSYGQILVTAIPGWTNALPSNTITEAGLNYTTASTLSSTTQTTLDFTNVNRNSPYTVSVRKADVDWNANLLLSVLRTSSGSGNSSISGGTTYLQLTSTDQLFFSGQTGNQTRLSNITCSYSFSGSTVLIPVKLYTTTVVFTISN